MLSFKTSVDLQSSVSRLGLYVSAGLRCDLGPSNVCTDPGRSDPMRVAAIVVLLVVTTPSEASKSCMSSSEARQHFGSAHIYWHGKGHCWNATPSRRHHRIHTVRNETRIHSVEKKVDEPMVDDEVRAQKAMPVMLLDEAPAQTRPVPTLWVDRWVEIQPRQAPIVVRQADTVQGAPPMVIEPEPMVTSRGVLMVIISIAVSLAIVDVLFGDVIYKRPMRRRPQPRVTR
jgi:hypothetical protein